MDKEREEIIVRTFFVKRLQDRVMFELSSPQKRENAIAMSRLCHESEKKLINKYMIEIPKPNSDYIEIAGLLKKYGTDKTSYCMSFDNDIDGKYMPTIVALKNVISFGIAPSIVSVIPDKLAYFQEEQIDGPPKRFILYKK
ncbi:hypothetical protein [Clostridium sp.]|mgnify:FL=1|uniref:hypothetical protein n=1 Tax=Clostridium sp. TaxID=1506 RepID=UPI003FD87308